MPLKKSKSKKAQSENISELVSTYEATGKIGTSKPKNKKTAIKQAVAISYAVKKEAGKKKKGKK